MTDAQQFFDSAVRQFNDLANDVERHFDLVAHQLSDWLPAGTPFSRPPPPKRLPPPTTLQSLSRWLSRNRRLSAAILAFLITGSAATAVYAYTAREQHRKRKRRARKAPNGARTEVLVVAASGGASVANPLASALYLDLERRGFIVYVVAGSEDEAAYIRSQSRADLLPLRLDPTNTFAAAQQIDRFADLLLRDHRAFDGAPPHRLHFAGLVMIPDSAAAPAPFEAVEPEEWSDALNARVWQPIVTAKLFLPSLLLHAQQQQNPGTAAAKLLLLTPSVTASLSPPTHTVESTIYGALGAWAASLAAELSPKGVVVSHFKLGNLDIPAVTAKTLRRGEGGAASASAASSSGSHGSSPSPSSTSIASSRLAVTPVRRLHDAVFDALVAKSLNRTCYVGRGSRTYDFIASWIPSGMVGWMMATKARLQRTTASTERMGPVKEEKEGWVGSSVGSLTWEKVQQDEGET